MKFTVDVDKVEYWSYLGLPPNIGTNERRRGEKIIAKGASRESERSSHAHFVESSRLCWVSLMLLAPIPWTLRIWELPFLTVMLPLERDYHQLSHRQQTLSDRARQTVGLVRHWLLEREPVVVDGNTYVAIDWLDSVRHAACIITRLRFETALYEAAPPRQS